MLKIILVPVMVLLLASGCTKKKVDDSRLKAIEDRLSAVEKIVLPPKPEVQSKAFNFPIGDSYVLGDPNAKMDIMVFTNLQCGYCARADKSLRELVETGGLKGEAKMILKHFPFMPRSKPAVKAAFAAGEQGAKHFWEFTEKAFANQRELTDKNFVKWAKELKLDVKKFSADLKANDDKYEKILAQDKKLVDEAKINYTPYVLVNGWKYQGDLNAGDLKTFAESKK